MSSLRARLFSAIIAGAAPLLLATAVGLALVLPRWMLDDFENQLLARALALASSHGGPIEGRQVPPPVVGGTGELFQIWHGEGIPWLRSAALGNDLPRQLPAVATSADPTAPRVEVVRYDDYTLDGGTPGRLVQLDRSALGPTPALTVVVALPRAVLDRRIGDLRVGIATGTLALLLVLTLVGATGSRWALRPLATLDHELRSLDTHSLDARLSLPYPPEELRSIVGRLNRWLDRLDLAFERERRWSSNVAHELRTPIAELRSLAEVALHGPRDSEMIEELFTDARDIAVQMEGIVNQLLSMARSESGIERVEWESLSLGEVLETCWASLAGKAEARRIVRRLEGNTAVRVESDRLKLQLILTNLLSNAITHSREGSTILCRVEDSPPPLGDPRNPDADDRGTVCLEISNPAPALEVDDLPRLFDRFWRKDPARTGSLHAGLGLALVRALAELLEISLEPRLEAGHLVLRLGLRGAPPNPVAR